MAVKSVNDTAGSNELVPTLLVFGCYPRMDKLDPLAPSIAQRAKVIQKAMSEVVKLRNSRQIIEALRQHNGPNTISTRNLAINSGVLVWRERSQKWEGPFRLLAVERETCKVQLPSGTIDFRITSVKLYIQKVQTHEQLCTGPEEPSALSNSRRRNPDRHRRLHCDDL
ncbi:hypothetical protein K3495_g12166 [Podosphaera aphanis]|nr:hypothetical protein K3495_g12166 [Podosphaera aphanis]